MKTGNENAYPEHHLRGNGMLIYTSPGMTLRQYYAGLAMQGFCANPNPGSMDLCMRMSVEYADALINELNKQP